MKNNIDLSKVRLLVTDYGFLVVGWEESILPLAKMAMIKYKKKLKTKRLKKKYAKILLRSVIASFLKESLEAKLKELKSYENSVSP